MWLLHLLCQAFPGLTLEKLKAGIFDGPQIRQLIRDPEFENLKNEVELEAWKAFVLVVKNFHGNNKARNYAELVNNMLTAFRNLGCNMSVKMHYLFSHMDRFPKNLGSMSDEQGKRFYQDLKELETRYQGRWDAVMMFDYCWNLKRDLPVAEHSRSSKKRKFKPWSLNNGEATCNLRALCGAVPRTCSILLAAFSCNCRQAFFPYVLLASTWCIHIAVSILPLLGRNCASFYRSGLTSIRSNGV